MEGWGAKYLLARSNVTSASRKTRLERRRASENRKCTFYPCGQGFATEFCCGRKENIQAAQPQTARSNQTKREQTEVRGHNTPTPAIDRCPAMSSPRPRPRGVSVTFSMPQPSLCGCSRVSRGGAPPLAFGTSTLERLNQRLTDRHVSSSSPSPPPPAVSSLFASSLQVLFLFAPQAV